MIAVEVFYSQVYRSLRPSFFERRSYSTCAVALRYHDRSQFASVNDFDLIRASEEIVEVRIPLK